MPPQIIKNGKLQEDNWTLLIEGEATSAGAQCLIPFKLWQDHRNHIVEADDSQIGVLLEPDTDPAEIAEDLGKLGLIAINFPVFTDGRGYSIARLLRERYKYTGELRAVGDVMHDQLFYLARCGFDSFQIKDNKDAEAALAGLNAFKNPYQAAADYSEPLYRRR